MQQNISLIFQVPLYFIQRYSSFRHLPITFKNFSHIQFEWVPLVYLMFFFKAFLNQNTVFQFVLNIRINLMISLFKDT